MPSTQWPNTATPTPTPSPGVVPCSLVDALQPLPGLRKADLIELVSRVLDEQIAVLLTLSGAEQTGHAIHADRIAEMLADQLQLLAMIIEGASP